MALYVPLYEKGNASSQDAAQIAGGQAHTMIVGSPAAPRKLKDTMLSTPFLPFTVMCRPIVLQTRIDVEPSAVTQFITSE